MKRLFLLLLLVLTGIACSGEVRRVVSLAPALTETVARLAGTEVLVGRSSACNCPEAVKKVPIAGQFGRLEVEKVLALKPDWVIANDLVNPAAAKALRRAGVKVDLAQCRNLDDYRAWVKRIGEMLNCQTQAAAELARTREAEAQFRALPKLSGKVLWVIWDAPLMVAGDGSLPDAALNLVGAQNAAAGVRSEYFKCSEEWILKHQPEVIIWGIPGAPDAGHRFWGKLSAVRENRVIAGLDDDLVLRPGPRWSDGLQLLRKALEEKLK